MVDDEIISERIYTIPLRDVKRLPRTKRAPGAIKHIRKFIARHMKSDISRVHIDGELNESIWCRGREHVGMSSKIQVKAIKLKEDDIIEVTLPDIAMSTPETEAEPVIEEDVPENVDESIDEAIDKDIAEADTGSEEPSKVVDEAEKEDAEAEEATADTDTAPEAEEEEKTESDGDKKEEE